MNELKINSTKSYNLIQTQQRPQVDYKMQFSKSLDNMKKGKPADYDEEAIKNQKTTTMTQILSDGSTLVTIYDEKGRVLSQNKTRAANPDPNAHIIGTEVETNDFGLDELTMEGTINLVNLQ